MESEIVIRKMKCEDLDRVMEVEKKSFTSPWSKLMFFDELQNPRAHYFVAEISGNIVAYAGLSTIIDEGHITNIAVHPLYRRMKIGSKLMETIIEMARKSKLRGLTLEVRVGNTAAISMYKRFGFKIEGLRKNYYSDNQEDAFIMWYYLDT
ncbi:MAG: ribosomal protein S18-alanine N-acetyltransferase [Clostridiaceae bacterium]|nr:ribosomal protein S18-alanine N-acetyltransferase [Clostridiaceae bacterium]